MNASAPADAVPRVTTTDGVDIAVHDLGGRGRPLVLAHATGLHGLVWQPLAAELIDDFRCFSLDARGHGDSDLPVDLDFAWSGLALDILAVIDGFGLERPLGVGHSSGGAAMLLAEQDRPGTFAALYCFEPTVLAADPPLGRDPDNWMAMGARRRRERFTSRQEAYDNYASKPPFSDVAPAALRAYVDHGFADHPDGGVELACRGEHEAMVHEMASAHDAFLHLGEVRCPVMLASGEGTEAFGPELIKGQAERLPDVRTEVVPGVSHLGPLEDPPAVAASVRRFFTGVV
ncbi:MAG: alpha/beta hydrolase [Acidimicrobiia bacterium]|nr:alpha/beta hydrolase [Acidimicrobiia bacterium]